MKKSFIFLLFSLFAVFAVMAGPAPDVLDDGISIEHALYPYAPQEAVSVPIIDLPNIELLSSPVLDAYVAPETNTINLSVKTKQAYKESWVKANGLIDYRKKLRTEGLCNSWNRFVHNGNTPIDVVSKQ